MPVPRRLRIDLTLAQTVVAILGAFLLQVGAARAGAFNLPEGDGIAIVDMTFSQGDRYFNGLGKLAPASLYRRGDASAYVEYGITDRLMAVGRADLTAIGIDGTPGARYLGIGPSEAGAQWRLLAYGPSVFAVQATFRLPASTDTRNLALGGATSHGADLRGLFGLSFALGPFPAFVDAQSAYRIRDSGAPDEIHTDLTLGVHARDDLMILLQLFDTHSVGDGTPWFPHESLTHVETAVVYDIDQVWSVELGIYTTVRGRRSLRESGVQSAVWYRF